MLNTCIFYCIYIQRKGKNAIFSLKKTFFFLNLYIAIVIKRYFFIAFVIIPRVNVSLF